MTSATLSRESHQSRGFLVSLFLDIREMGRELVQYRELLYLLTWRDILLRYKQSVMGFGWAVLMPVANTAIFWLIFTRVAPLKTDLPYPVYAYTGLVAWNLFAASLKFSVNSLTSNGALVTKVYFPRELLPLSAVLVSLLDFFVGALVLVPLMIYYHLAVHWTIILIPVIVAVQVAFTAGVALLLAMGNLFYRDVKYLFEFVLTFWMFATAVVYPVTGVGGSLGKLLLLNPMTPIVEAYRSVILRGELPGAAFGLAAVAAFVVLAIGWIVFHRAEFKFAESV
ncbi:MAG: tagG 1 [Gemmatimonadales bacterium]|jgi:ABC-type polysaccharide/polyol phosphate export permease|nr:tagG 1 [Gemmatimonadales bacterium]